MVASTVEAKGRFESKKAELLKILEPAGGTWGIFIEDLAAKGASCITTRKFHCRFGH